VPLDGAVRIALSAVRTEDVPRLVNGLVDAIDLGVRRHSGVRGLLDARKKRAG
jgi:hypothetical protein